MSPIDPFALKSRPRWHPLRAGYVGYSRAQELIARSRFSSYALPVSAGANGEAGSIPDTAVTSFQLECLKRALQATEHLQDTAVVEVGAFRGVTSAWLASNTRRRVFAVDPYIGYGGSAGDLAAFQAATRGFANLAHLRVTSGEGSRTWSGPPISLLFIDAVHDYVNVRFDIAAWSRLMAPGGLIAAHDTDNAMFAGTRRAVFEASRRFGVFLHTEDLTILGPVR